MTQRTPTAVSNAAHAIMFWVLAGMSFSLFAPAVLLPLWEESRDLHTYEQMKLLEIDKLAAQRSRNSENIAALKEDPLVIERIARRERFYRPETGEGVQTPSQQLATMPVRLPPELLAEPAPELAMPAWVNQLQQWLPNWPYRKLFVQMPNRLLMLLMAGGLLVTAFVLYGPNGGSAGKAELRVTKPD